ncbi:hypothetical protein Slin14017_G023020 [Septoria linicola]|nr:hypothetical protein Slin14017_G023020 [Septoria linicola]
MDTLNKEDFVTIVDAIAKNGAENEAKKIGDTSGGGAAYAEEDIKFLVEDSDWEDDNQVNFSKDDGHDAESEGADRADDAEDSQQHIGLKSSKDNAKSAQLCKSFKSVFYANQFCGSCSRVPLT